MKNADNDLLTVSQLSKKLKLSIVWLRAQAEKGILPCINADGKLLFNLQAVNTKLAQLAAKGGYNEQ